ncbi:MAG: rhodanese-like domain-containing protein [Candidatus Babeliaceae bacterium]
MNFKSLLLVICGALLMLAFSCGKKEEQKPQLYILDVNSPEQYTDAHIKGAVHGDLSKIKAVVKEWDKSVPVVIYCSNYMCTASGSVAQQLKEMGFTNVRAYEGGIAEWYQLSKKNPEYVYEGPAQQEFLNIVMEKPVHEVEPDMIIDAQDLQKLMKSANIL